MTHSDLYQAYTHILQKLNRLQSEYRDIPDNESARGKRQSLQEQIINCQQRLLSVTEKLIYCNPFQNGMRIKHGVLNEMVV